MGLWPGRFSPAATHEGEAMKRNPAAFGSRERKKADAGLKRVSRSGVAGARKRKQNAGKRKVQSSADTYQRLELKRAAGGKLTKAQAIAHAKHEAAFLASRGMNKAEAAQATREHEKRVKTIARILGPSGVAHAVKVAHADGSPFRSADVAAWRKLGWGVEPAGSISGRAGAGGLAGTVITDEDWPIINPEPLGAGGVARAVVLTGRVDESLLLDLVADGYDVAAAPKKLREGTTRNPAPAPLQKKVYAAMIAAAKKNTALRVDEIAKKIKAPSSSVAEAVQRLSSLGMVHEAGRDLFGACWLPGTPSRGLFANPSAKAKAEKKAKAWFGKESLVTKAQEIDWTPPESAVHIGQFVAIEYLSDKFDGTKRIYRHDVTKVRQMLLSPDGSTIIVDPPFKITKRGIEG